ncbi:hypothetical protein ACHAWU_009321 [Discostella pseudostelligera]|uniref:Sugar phosphate transporter domain-containing protein n=1 Tax=Discostella pseudostelligera TaxID=259834 RepID=A0ABD3N207_9STRA
MSLEAPTSFTSSMASNMATVAAASSSSSPVAESLAAAMTPLSSWASSVANNRLWVGTAWMISSAILTTYSTTRFLKYVGKEDVDQGHGTASRQFRSILNSTQNTQQQQQAHSQKVIEQSPRKSIRQVTTKLSRASLLTLYRFSGSLLLGLLIHSHFYQLSKLIPRFIDTVHVAQKFLLPSLFLFIANYSNSIALDRIGISLTYTSKCGIPLITVLFTLLLDGISSLPSTATLLSLVPIALGIGASSWNSPTFELFGFLAAMVSTTSQAALNVVSKRVMRKTGVVGVEAQRAMVFVALGIGLLMTAVNGIGETIREVRQYAGAGTSVQKAGNEDEYEVQDAQSVGALVAPSHPPFWLTFLAVLAYHMEYVLSFSFVGMVEPITYGTCDALRRLLIIVTGRRLFGGDKFSALNLGGILMALMGALMFSVTSARGR